MRAIADKIEEVLQRIDRSKSGKSYMRLSPTTRVLRVPRGIITRQPNKSDQPSHREPRGGNIGFRPPLEPWRSSLAGPPMLIGRAGRREGSACSDTGRPALFVAGSGEAPVSSLTRSPIEAKRFEVWPIEESIFSSSTTCAAHAAKKRIQDVSQKGEYA